jgi:hypothetical protein
MTTKFEQTHISMILDRSGSMASCSAETINAVNTYLAKAREDSVLKEADLELMIFDNESIDCIRSGAPIALADITAEDFVPRGYTPLYDAIGRGIDSLDARLAKSGSSKAILVAATDGMENASRKHNHGSIAELIRARQDKGWLVIFLGAGLDAARQGMALGIRAASTANIGTDAESWAGVARRTFAMSASYAECSSPQEFMESDEAQFSAAARAEMGDKSGGAGLVTPQSAGEGTKPAAVKPSDAWHDKTDAWA